MIHLIANPVPLAETIKPFAAMAFALAFIAFILWLAWLLITRPDC